MPTTKTGSILSISIYEFTKVKQNKLNDFYVFYESIDKLQN